MANTGDVKVINGIGSIYYRHAWINERQVKWWGDQEISLKLIFSASPGEEITDAQKESFSSYQENVGRIVAKGLGTLTAFIKDDYGLDISMDRLFEVLRPTSVVFRKDGVWGILFDAEFDIEGGVALFQNSKSGDFCAGGQDDFL